MPDHHPFRPSNGGYSLRGCARREVPLSWWCGHLWGHEKSGCAVGAVPPSWFRRRSCRICRARPWVSNPCLVLHNGCRSCRIGMDHEWLTLLLTFTQHSPPPPTPRTPSRHAPRSTTTTSPPHQKHLTHTTHHPRHAPVSTEPRDNKEPPRHPPVNHPQHPSPPPPRTSHTTHRQEPINDPRTSTTPYVMPTSTQPRGTLHVPHPPPEHPHPMYVHNLRNAHTEPPFRTYTRHRNHRSSTPPQEHTAPSEHHAPTDNKAPSYPTQKPPQPPKTHPKEATTPTSPIPTQVSQRTPLLDPEGQATPGPKPEGLTTTHAQHTAHPRKEDPPPEAQPSRPVAPPPEGRLHETRDPTYNTRNLRHPVRPPRQDPLHHRHPLSTPVTTYTLSHCGFLARVLNTQRDPYGHLG